MPCDAECDFLTSRSKSIKAHLLPVNLCHPWSIIDIDIIIVTRFTFMLCMDIAFYVCIGVNKENRTNTRLNALFISFEIAVIFTGIQMHKRIQWTLS